MASKSFGLDIGARSIRAVSLNKQKNGFFLESSFVIPSPIKSILSSSPLEEKEMAKALKELGSKAKVKTKNVNIALPDNRVYINVIKMPVLSDADLLSAIRWETEQYIPVPLSEINLVWSVLEKEEKMRILMVGAPITLIKKYQKVIEMAGFNVVSIETEILSVVRALIYSKDADTKKHFPNTAIVHIDEEHTSLAIVKEGTLLFTYTILVGGAAINRALEADFGLTEAESEEYKEVYGVSKESIGGKLRDAVEPILALILNEIKKALAFYKEKYESDTPIQQFILSGSIARLPGMQVFFVDALGIETVTANPWIVLTDQNLPKEILDDAPSYTVAIGLAMRGYE